MKLHVIVKPSRESAVLGWDGKVLQVRVNAPPIKGAANKRLVEILSSWLAIPKSHIQIVKGHSARLKVLEIHTSNEHVLRQKIQANDNQ